MSYVDADLVVADEVFADECRVVLVEFLEFGIHFYSGRLQAFIQLADIGAEHECRTVAAGNHII